MCISWRANKIEYICFTYFFILKCTWCVVQFDVTVNAVHYYALFGDVWCSVQCRHMLLTAVHCIYYNVHSTNAESLLEVEAS